MSKEENGKLAPKKDRYWSVMLVGDRGRVIPFRHFKGIALSVCCLSILLLAAAIVLAILYISQGPELVRLKSELKDAQAQISKLRDEKDLYLTKLMVTQTQENAAAKNTPEEDSKSEEPAAAAKMDGDKGAPEVDTSVKAEAAEPVKKKEAPAKPPEPEVNWNADIRRFSAEYDAKQEVLKAQFRIYNTSNPKKRLAGRSVVVFKVQDEPPVKWMPVPRVQLNSGEPGGKQGQTFRVRNYLTMTFRAYRQKAPVQFNTATVYIFSEDGKMLASKDFAFKIETPPPPPPKKEPAPQPAPPAETKAPATPATAPAVEPAQDAAQPTQGAEPAVSDTQGKPGAVPVVPAPESGPTPAEKPPAVQPAEAPAEAPQADTPPDIVDSPPAGTPEDGASDIPTQTETPPETETPATAPQPKVEGDTR